MGHSKVVEFKTEVTAEKIELGPSVLCTRWFQRNSSFSMRNIEISREGEGKGGGH